MRFPSASMLVAGTLALYTAMALAAPNLHEGMWQITTTVDVKGISLQPPMEPRQDTHCLTRADIEHPENIVPPQANCSLHDVNITGDTMQWQIECTGPIAATGSGEAVYSADAFSGTAMVVGQIGGLKAEISTIYQGRRIGDCN